jgi:glycerophosphoryl diester phosphodiesterase
MVTVTPQGPSRRSVLLGAGGLLALAGVAACTSPGGQSFTVQDWVAQRGRTYLIGHRGAGDVIPEHTMEAYEAAVRWGAKAVEVSVVRLSDDVLICHHDLTFDRTTNLKGSVSEFSSAVLSDARVEIPRLGPRWQGQGRPLIPRLEDVLDRLGGRAVLCIEAKDDTAYPLMVDLVKSKGMDRSVIVKMHHGSPRLAEAKDAGFPRFVYLGSFAETTPALIREVAAGLDRARDVLIIPSTEGGEIISDELVDVAVGTGVPVWVFAAHRRSEVAHHFANGVVGAVVSSIGYVARTAPPVRGSALGEGLLHPGEMTRDPGSDAWALGWPDGRTVALRRQDGQAFLTLGQLAPLPQPTGPYQLDLEMRVDRSPSDPGSNFTVAFAHPDDRYYEHRQGTQDGYHALLRMDGRLELWTHQAGAVSGTQLAGPLKTAPPAIGSWVPLRLQVTPTTLTWGRPDTGELLTQADHQMRGDFIHLGRSAVDGEISLRNVRLT